MPYVITTYEDNPHTRDPDARVLSVVSRRAVATVDEAREAAAETVRDRRPAKYWDGIWHTLAERATLLPESGGTIGPLPDGTVIEVGRVHWPELAHAANLIDRPLVPLTAPYSDEVIIAAYNEAQSS